MASPTSGRRFDLVPGKPGRVSQALALIEVVNRAIRGQWVRSLWVNASHLHNYPTELLPEPERRILKPLVEHLMIFRESICLDRDFAPARSIPELNAAAQTVDLIHMVVISQWLPSARRDATPLEYLAACFTCKASIAWVNLYGGVMRFVLNPRKIEE